MSEFKSDHLTLSQLTQQERMDLSVLMQFYITDACVKEHEKVNHQDHEQFWNSHEKYFTSMEEFLKEMQSKPTGERVLLRRDGSVYQYGDIQRMIPLPAWDPATPIPKEFQLVRQPDQYWVGPATNLQMMTEYLTASQPERPRLVDVDPKKPKPDDFKGEALLQYADLERLHFDVSAWHSQVHLGIGGAMRPTDISSSALIFWPFHAFVSDVKKEWEMQQEQQLAKRESQYDASKGSHQDFRDIFDLRGSPYNDIHSLVGEMRYSQELGAIEDTHKTPDYYIGIIEHAISKSTLNDAQRAKAVEVLGKTNASAPFFGIVANRFYENLLTEERITYAEVKGIKDTIRQNVRLYEAFKPELGTLKEMEKLQSSELEVRKISANKRDVELLNKYLAGKMDGFKGVRSGDADQYPGISMIPFTESVGTKPYKEAQNLYDHIFEWQKIREVAKKLPEKEIESCQAVDHSASPVPQCNKDQAIVR